MTSSDRIALETESTLAVAQFVACTEAEGPGKRFALWLQGCPLRCPECCNPEMLPFTGGQPWPVSKMADQIFLAAREQAIEGITLLGGEPFAHAGSAAGLCRLVQQQDLSVMIFSGYTLEEIRQNREPAVRELLSLTDILVDGPYMRELPESQRRWIGSQNQRIHFLTKRYQANDPRWLRKNTLELRLIDGELTVNGFPAKEAVGLWKKI